MGVKWVKSRNIRLIKENVILLDVESALLPNCLTEITTSTERGLVGGEYRLYISGFRDIALES